MGYDAAGRRTVVETNGESRTQIYDHEGRLLLELEPALATGCNPANDRVFCSSFEKPPANLAQTRYVYLGRHLIGKDGAPGLRYLHTDALGSLVAETDANQTVTQRYHYLPYGAAFGTMPDGPGYAGNVMDPSGLVYMQARYYDPQLGRFLSTDPVDPDPQTGMNFNRYAYADNNPFAKYDPSGRDAACIYTEGTCDDGSGAGDAFLSDVIDSVLPPMMAMQPEIGAAEGVAVAAAEEVAEATPAIIESIGQGIESGTAAFEDVAGIATSSQLGKEGESAVREMYDIGNKISFDVAGKTRIPDGTNFALDTLSEVKNVGYQGFTSQLRDYTQIAQENDLTFNLYLRPTTSVSGPLQQAFDCGWICRLDIPQ